MWWVGEDYLLAWKVAAVGRRFFLAVGNQLTGVQGMRHWWTNWVEKRLSGISVIGQTIRVKNIPFRVIGVLAAKGANMVGEDQDNVLLMPYSTAQKRVQGTTFESVNAIMVSVRFFRTDDSGRPARNRTIAHRSPSHRGT